MKILITAILLLTSFVYAQDTLDWTKESQKRLSWSDANIYCKNNNATLPSFDLMMKMWEKHDKTSEIAGFDLSVSYWTSTEEKGNPKAAHPFYFGTGKEGWYYKKDHYGVRCVK